MALIICPDCRREISDAARNCPGCGRPNRALPPIIAPPPIPLPGRVHQVKPRSRFAGWLLALALVVVVVIGIGVVVSAPDSAPSERKIPHVAKQATEPAPVAEQVSASSVQADQGLVNLAYQGMASEIERNINLLADYTTTRCFPAGGSNGAMDLVVISSSPVIRTGASPEKGWLLATVGAVGGVLNAHPDIKSGQIAISDLDHVKSGVIWMIDAGIAQSLQRRIKNDEINLDQFYAEVKANLAERQTAQ